MDNTNSAVATAVDTKKLPLLQKKKEPGPNSPWVRHMLSLIGRDVIVYEAHSIVQGEPPSKIIVQGKFHLFDMSSTAVCVQDVNGCLVTIRTPSVIVREVRPR